MPVLSDLSRRTKWYVGRVKSCLGGLSFYNFFKLPSQYFTCTFALKVFMNRKGRLKKKSINIEKPPCSFFSWIMHNASISTCSVNHNKNKKTEKLSRRVTIITSIQVALDLQSVTQRPFTETAASPKATYYLMSKLQWLHGPMVTFWALGNHLAIYLFV